MANSVNKLVTKDLGPVTAYSVAVENGFNGTEEDWVALQVNTASNAVRAEAAAVQAENVVESFLSQKGSPNGIAQLDQSGKVPASQLPSYVDDVLECVDLNTFPAEGESSKIYVALDTNLTYRWSGSAYVEISQSLALGETASTAFPGDRGKAIEDALPTYYSDSEATAVINRIFGA